MRDLWHVSSTDHGRTFSAHTVIDPGNQNHEHPPIIASDPKTGALYVAWSAQPDAMNLAPGYLGDLDVYFRSSTDGGKTWTDKRRLNDDTSVKENHIDPGIAVAPNGRIDVAWYDGRNNPGPVGDRTELGLNDVYATYSTDGGKTFAPNVRVSDRSADRSVGVWANNIDQRLNVGVASSNGGAYIAWSDDRNANADFQPEDIYTATVRFAPTEVAAAKSRSAPTGWPSPQGWLWGSVSAWWRPGCGYGHDWPRVPRRSPRRGPVAGMTRRRRRLAAGEPNQAPFWTSSATRLRPVTPPGLTASYLFAWVG